MRHCHGYLALFFSVVFFISFSACSKAEMSNQSQSGNNFMCSAREISELKAELCKNDNVCLKDSVTITKIDTVVQVCKCPADECRSVEPVAEEASSVYKTSNETTNTDFKVKADFEKSRSYNVSVDAKYEKKKNNTYVDSSKKSFSLVINNILKPYFKNEVFGAVECSTLLECSVENEVIVSFGVATVLLIIFGFWRYKKKKVQKKINKRSPSPGSKLNEYASLEPVSDLENYQVALDQLTYAMSKRDGIKNIAITGQYGAGKTSLWKTFLKKNPSICKPVEISLACFTGSGQYKPYRNRWSENDIEKSLLQQLMYSVERSKVVYSRMSRIKNKSGFIVALESIAIWTCLCVVLPLTNDTVHNAICELAEMFWFPIVVSYIVVGLVLFGIVFKSIKKVNKCIISKIGINTLEVSFDDKESLFNKYLDEIVYFFEATKFNCLLIEDVDRFDTSDILQKFREINKLINDYPPIKKNGVVKFVYAVRDDVLTKYERTKFFDFIIPVIPYLSKGNAAERIEAYFRGVPEEIRPVLSEEFRYNMKNFLNDFRLVKNCINEYAVYYGELKTFLSKENFEMDAPKVKEMIFSLVLYKNFYPKDFSLLQKNEGVLSYCLNECLRNFEGGAYEGKSLQDVLNGRLAYNLRSFIAAEKYKIENKLDFGEREKIEIDFLMQLLSNGYIETGCDRFIHKLDDLFEYGVNKIYLLNILNDIPSSDGLVLESLNSLEKRISTYQWNSRGVVNQKMILHILDKYKEKHVQDTVVPKVVNAMLKYGQSKGFNYLRKIFVSLNEKTKEMDLFFAGINSLVESENKEKRDDLLSQIFIGDDFAFFEAYLDSLILADPDLMNDINQYLDKRPSFVDSLFKKHENDFRHFVLSLELSPISLNLTDYVAKLLVENEILQTTIYSLTKDNVDRILKFYNLSLDESGYMSKCLSIKGLNKKIQKDVKGFVENILINFEKIEENYLSLKLIFSNSDLDSSEKTELFDRMVYDWNSFVLYKGAVRLDLELKLRIREYLQSHESWGRKEKEEEDNAISNLLAQERNRTLGFVSSVVSDDWFEEKELKDVFLPIWEQFVSILECFEERVELINKMPSRRIQFLIHHVQNVGQNSLNSIPFLYMIRKEPVYFEDLYEDDYFAQDSSLKRLILSCNYEELESIQRRFLRATYLYPNDVSGKNIYQKAARKLSKPTSYDIEYLTKRMDDVNRSVAGLGDVNLYAFQSKVFSKVFNLADGFASESYMIEDYWAKILWNFLKNRIHDLSNYVAFNTYPYPNGIQGLREIDRNNSDIVMQMNQTYQGKLRSVMERIDEMNAYLKEFKP